jgi:hypothetical protein
MRRAQWCVVPTATSMPNDRCARFVTVCVRDSGKQVIRHVCERHVAWAQEDVRAQGLSVRSYRTADGKYLTSGCVGPGRTGAERRATLGPEWTSPSKS